MMRLLAFLGAIAHACCASPFASSPISSGHYPCFINCRVPHHLALRRHLPLREAATVADGLALDVSDASTSSLGNDDDHDGFRPLIQKAVQALVMGDTDGEELDHSYGSASQGLWLHAPSAGEMQRLLDRVVLKLRLMLRAGQQLWARSAAEGVHRAAVADGTGDANEELAPQPNHNNTQQSNHSNVDEDGQSDSAKDEEGFDTLIHTALQTIIESDIRRGEFSGNSDGSSSQGRWLYDPAAKELQSVMDRLVMAQDSALSIEDEQCSQWLQWMKAAPSPLFLDLTTHVHDIITQNHLTHGNTSWVSEEHLEFIDMSLDQYISRIACHIILLPSGSETSPLSLVESTGAHIYGKLLYGGVSRYRLLKSGRTVRRAGESREVLDRNNRSRPSWIQLGGLERRYEAIDMGPAAVLELTLLPRLWQDLPTIFDKSVLMGDASVDMTASDAAFDPSTMLQLLPQEEEGSSKTEWGAGVEPAEQSVFGSLEGNEKNAALTAHFQSRVGGLQPQIDAIVRRVLDGRSVYATLSQDGNDTNAINQARLEAEELSLLGLQPVRGMLLYGRPGVGKTLIVREISRLLTARPPKIVSASELLDRWVGGSERLVRELFGDAEDELRICQQMAAGTGEEEKAFLNSALHVLVIDEIDAVFRHRIDSDDSGAATRNSIVNQLLAKLDGVHALPNVLMIGMTNRRELIDPALLRPGRLEVQIEIPLPERDQRREILHIHFGALRRRNRLSCPLRCAIDGVASNNAGESSSEATSNRGRKRRALKRAASNVLDFISAGSTTYDLADETEGFSGADIEGLVRCAGSRALSRARKQGSGVESLLITLEDVQQALMELKA